MDRSHAQDGRCFRVPNGDKSADALGLEPGLREQTIAFQPIHTRAKTSSSRGAANKTGVLDFAVFRRARPPIQLDTAEKACCGAARVIQALLEGRQTGGTRRP